MDKVLGNVEHCHKGSGLHQAFIVLNAAALCAGVGYYSNSKAVRRISSGLAVLFVIKVVDIWDLSWGIFWNAAVLCGVYVFWKIVPVIAGLFRNLDHLEEGLVGQFRPLFFFSATTHSRFTPTKHRFKYPLLYVGFPVTFKGSIGSLLTVKGSEDEEAALAKRPFTFFTLDPKTYYEPDLSFDKKMVSVLNYHGYNPNDYPFVYFVTTPQFFGYSFNPVSYWYLYDQNRKLQLVVLEVKNTFGEKHVYFMDTKNPENFAPRPGYDFAGAMTKSFHISPFNHRSGDYLIHLRDPLNPTTTGEAKFDIFVTVRARDGSKSMVARAFSTYAPFDPITGNIFTGLSLVFKWGWGVFMAVPATMFEAWKIYRKRAKVYDRPEVLSTSGQRTATKAEKEMQDLWITYVRQKLSEFPRPLRLSVYLPQSSPLKEAEMQSFTSPSFSDNEKVGEELIVRVKNPRFFYRFFSHQHPSQTLFLDSTLQKPEHRAADISDTETLLNILGTRKGSQPIARKGWIWTLLAWSRQRKSYFDLTEHRATNSSSRGELPEPSLLDRSIANPMDEFFLSDPSMSSYYTRKVAQALMIDIVAFGDAESYQLYRSATTLFFLLLSIGVGMFTAIQYNAISLTYLKSFDFDIRTSISLLLCPGFILRFFALNGVWILPSILERIF